MENLVNLLPASPAFWSGRKVLVTGHTGFKGSWLSLWLAQLGAQVTGLSLPAEEPSLFRQARIGNLVHHTEGDIRDAETVEAAVRRARPEVVFHLAAQPLVHLSYELPVETYATNVQGTVHILDACRRVEGVKAIVSITSDKCYDNREWVWPYRETDRLGGRDPYSSSKAAAELVVAAFRCSYFDEAEGPLLASVRSGNVIGGGDWARDRLVPDIVRALLAGRPPVIRRPGAIRPWQHVLEALGGYLVIAERLVARDRSAASAWNFGPLDEDARPVSWVADRLVRAWDGNPSLQLGEGDGGPHEANVLKLDCTKVQCELGWRPTWRLSAALDRVVEWHRHVAVGGDAREISLRQLDRYRQDCAQTTGSKDEYAL